jgi:hypothetical protein
MLFSFSKGQGAKNIGVVQKDYIDKSTTTNNTYSGGINQSMKNETGQMNATSTSALE